MEIDFKLLLIGAGFLLGGILMLYSIKGTKVASKENNWEGQTPAGYYQFWIWTIICIITGLVIIIEAFGI